MGSQRKPNAPCTAEIFELVISSLYGGVIPTQVVENNKDNPSFPTLSTIYKYAMSDNARKKAYIDAREAAADMFADDTIFIADNVRDPQFANNRIKARQWLASKVRPKVYGDKLDLEVTGRVDISAAILEARKRIQLPSVEPMTIEHEPVDPFS